jgi:hypothetical protein
MRMKAMESTKDELVSIWRTLRVSVPQETEDRFQMVTGGEQILARIREILSRPDTAKMVCCSETTLSRMYYAGVFDTMHHAKAGANRLLVLTEVTPRNRRTISSLKVAHIRQVQVRQPPNFVIDGERDVVFVLDHSNDLKGKNSSAMWSSHKPLVRSMRSLFSRLWNDSVDLDQPQSQLQRELPLLDKTIGEMEPRSEQAKKFILQLFRESGHEVFENKGFQGQSGIDHVFDFCVEIPGKWPLVIDIPEGVGMETDVLRTYAKVSDLKKKVKAILILSRRASDKVATLASSYGISLLEF